MVKILEKDMAEVKKKNTAIRVELSAMHRKSAVINSVQTTRPVKAVSIEILPKHPETVMETSDTVKTTALLTKTVNKSRTLRFQKRQGKKSLYRNSEKSPREGPLGYRLYMVHTERLQEKKR